LIDIVVVDDPFDVDVLVEVVVVDNLDMGLEQVAAVVVVVVVEIDDGVGVEFVVDDGKVEIGVGVDRIDVFEDDERS
jgi:hypothetical protein